MKEYLTLSETLRARKEPTCEGVIVACNLYGNPLAIGGKKKFGEIYHDQLIVYADSRILDSLTFNDGFLGGMQWIDDQILAVEHVLHDRIVSGQHEVEQKVHLYLARDSLGVRALSKIFSFRYFLQEQGDGSKEQFYDIYGIHGRSGGRVSAKMEWKAGVNGPIQYGNYPEGEYLSHLSTFQYLPDFTLHCSAGRYTVLKSKDPRVLWSSATQTIVLHEKEVLFECNCSLDDLVFANSNRCSGEYWRAEALPSGAVKVYDIDNDLRGVLKEFVPKEMQGEADR